MARFSLTVLSLIAAAQANPLWGLQRRQVADICGNPTVTVSASLVLTGAGDALYTYTPSRVADSAQWSIQTPVTITEPLTTSTIYPFGYVWALSGTPGSLEVPTLPTTDVPYPLPVSASITLCGTPAQTNIQPTSTLPDTTTSAADNSVPPIFPTPTTGPGAPTTLATFVNTTPTSSAETLPNTEPETTTETETETTSNNTPPTTSTTVNNTPPTTTTSVGLPTSTETTGTETTGPQTTEPQTTDSQPTTTASDTENPGTPTSTQGPDNGTTDTATTGSVTTSESTGTASTDTDTTAAAPTTTTTDGVNSDSTTAATTTGTEADTTTGTEAGTTTGTEAGTTTGQNNPENTTKTDPSAGTTDHTENPDAGATTFPTFNPPTATVTGAAATSKAVEIGPLIFSLWNNRDMLKNDDDLKKKYIDQVEETKDDIVTLWNNFDVKPPIPGPCGQISLKKRSLISGIIGLLDTAAKLIGCAEQIVDNLDKQVKLPEPDINIVETLTDTLKDISNELEKDDDKPTKTQSEDKSSTGESTATTQPSTTTTGPTTTTEPPTTTTGPTTTTEPTTTESCTASGVESCSQTVYLSTSFYKDGDTDTSTVETITTVACATITACDAVATTEVTTVTTATSESYLICDYNCAACLGSKTKRAEPTSQPLVERSLEGRSLTDKEEIGNSKGDKSNYILEIVEGQHQASELNWAFASVDLVSIDGPFGNDDARAFVQGLTGCTGIAVVSKAGYWLAHFMEPGFIDGNEFDLRRWNTRIINVMENGSNKYTIPDTLAADGGFLSSANDPIIYLSTPIGKDGGRLYNDKVNIIMDKLTGNGAPFHGVEVRQLLYQKPVGEQQAESFARSAAGKIVIEYTPDQPRLDPETFEESTPDPREKMIRVWQEWTDYELIIPRYGEPQCNPPTEEADGADPSFVNQLADLFCTGKDVDFSADAELTLGGGDLDPAMTLNADFKFTFTKRSDGDCSQSCTDIYSSLIHSCQYNSHVFTGEADATYECGKYAVEAVKKAAPPPSTQPEVRDNCADTSVYTSFTLDQATKAIEAFCAHDITLLKAAQPVKETFKMDGVTLQLWTQWSSKGQDGCNHVDNPDYGVPSDVCKERFLGAVNDCNTDTTTEKYGNYPYIWNSPNGCIDFWIYGDGADFTCDEILGVVPVPCQTNGVTLP
ncbi:hypothetical protein BGZ63DRAFT_365966 [Mariannaea sp. PMI_226]|nr:hypothetical protein BGZ63DRAFT_365966 [Mariannaea sp. PMI_226]